jgi:hypothetical protein
MRRKAFHVELMRNPDVLEEWIRDPKKAFS